MVAVCAVVAGYDLYVHVVVVGYGSCVRTVVVKSR